MVALKEQKYHLYLSDDEYRQTIQSLVRLKNNLISQGRYTDAVDDVLFKVLKTKRACTRNNHILWLGKRRHNRPYRYRWKVRKRKYLHHRGQFVRHVQNQNISGWKFSYLRIRHSGILKKMAARLSSHQVHYSWEILFSKILICSLSFFISISSFEVKVLLKLFEGIKNRDIIKKKSIVFFFIPPP